MAEQPRHLFAPSASGAERPEERRQLSRIGSARVLYPHNWDVPRYLACGLADGGVLGQDVLLETGLRVTDEVDLAVARCRLSLIRRVGFAGRIRRVATRYPRLASRYLSRSQGVEVVSGNVELACVVGLADAVIDIVATGTTLRVHRLEEVEAIMESTARFVVHLSTRLGTGYSNASTTI